LVRSISFALYSRGVQYLQCASGRVPYSKAYHSKVSFIILLWDFWSPIFPSENSDTCCRFLQFWLLKPMFACSKIKARRLVYILNFLFKIHDNQVISLLSTALS
jgi:hypothetical protein